jgi:hypothetical protein
VTGVPSFSVVYGQSGLGKSTDMAATHPNGLFVCRPGGMQCAGSFLGLGVREAHVRTLEEVIGLIPVAKDAGHDAIIVDDLSLVAESSSRDIDINERNRYAKFDKMNVLTATLREQGRYVGIHFAANAHERTSGHDSQGRPRPGGPKLPSWNMSDSVVHEASLVLRATTDNSIKLPWQAVYDRGDGSTWVGKDRHSATQPRNPQNLRAILTLGGYTLARAPGLEWQDEVVNQVREKLQSGEDRSTLIETVWTRLTGKGGLDPRHVAWALRDALATVELASASEGRWRKLFTPLEKASASL